MTNFSLQIANETHGLMFDWSSRNFTPQTVVETDSSSKLVSGIAILSILGNETLDLSYKTLAGQILPFWTNDTADARSKITLKHLLSLTSGFTTFLSESKRECDLNMDLPQYFPGNFVRSMQKEFCRTETAPDRKCETFLDCVKDTYNGLSLKYEPGTVWDYCGFNIQSAGAIAEVASGRAIQTILEDFLDAVGMKRSYFEGGAHVQLDGSLQASTEDYMTFLTKLCTGKILAPQLYDSLFDLNTDYPMEVKTFYSWIFRSFLGRYSIANWYECPIDLDEHMRPECITDDVHSCAGLSGFYPIIDHKLKYWMVIGHKGMPVFGCVNSVLLRLAIKPHIDEIITGRPHLMSLDERLELAKKQLKKFDQAMGHIRK